MSDKECVYKANSYITVLVVKHGAISDMDAVKQAIDLLKEEL